MSVALMVHKRAISYVMLNMSKDNHSTEKGKNAMAKIYFTITGTNYRHGSEFLEPNMQVRLVKEPDNKYDTEAIKVEMEGLGKIGYVANSASTRIGESWSAGRMYDKIDNVAYGTVKYVLPNGVLCVLDKCSKKE